jgi:hypothetical protein
VLSHTSLGGLNALPPSLRSLSTQLVDVDGAVERMRGPLLALRDKVAAAREVAQTQLDALQEGLAARAALAQQRATLQLCVDAQHAAAKLERLVEEVKKADGPSEQAAMPTPTVEALLDRAVAEATRATLLLSRGEDLPFMRGVAPRANNAREALCTRLSAALRAALDAGDVTAARRWLAAYASARDADGAAAVLGELLVRPLVNRVLADDSSAAGATATLQPCLEVLRTALQPHSEVLFMDGAGHGANSQQHAGNALDVVRGMALGGRAILREVDAALGEKRPDAFSPGRPDAFRGNHVAVTHFCGWVATSCVPSDGAAGPGLAAVRAAQEALLRRFNLGAYFGIRFQDIASAMEASLTAKTPLDAPPAGFYPPAEDGAAPPPGLATTAGAAAWLACRRPFHDQVYLPALADKCLALSLQCVTRLAAWTAAGCEARKKANAAADAAAAAAEAAAAAASSSGTAAPVPAPAAQTTSASAGLPTDWAVHAGPEELVSLWCDTVALAAYLRGDTHRSLVLGAMRHVESAHGAVVAALDDVAGEILEAGAPAQAMAAVVVADRCMEVLRQIKGITATYRMTNKPAPTRHSHFVPGVTQPLRAILDGPRLSASLSADAKRSFSHAVALVVTSRYEELARELVTTVKKTESSLRRLRERRAAGGPGAAATPAGGDSDMSDTDKICRQLVLDAQEFGRQLSKFGVDATSLPPFKELLKVVGEEEK